MFNYNRAYWVPEKQDIEEGHGRKHLVKSSGFRIPRNEQVRCIICVIYPKGSVQSDIVE